jgi:hypothetical protein
VLAFVQFLPELAYSESRCEKALGHGIGRALVPYTHDGLKG